MHSYRVKYIGREGYVTTQVFFAESAKEARQKASDSGCEDILRVSRAGLGRKLIVLAVLAALAFVFLAAIVLQV